MLGIRFSTCSLPQGGDLVDKHVSLLRFDTRDLHCMNISKPDGTVLQFRSLDDCLTYQAKERALKVGGGLNFPAMLRNLGKAWKSIIFH